MKKFLSLILIGMLCFTLVGCGNTDNNNDNGNNNNNQNNNGGNKNEETGAAKFFNIFKSNNYHMKAKMVVEGQEMVIESYYKDGKAAVLMESSTGKVKMLFRDDKMYIINDDEKSMTVMAGTNSEDDNQIETDGMTKTGSGKADFNGKNYSYEEYSNEDGEKMWYFMHGNDLVGIRNFNDGGNIDMIILAIDQKVPNNIFDVPTGYKKTEY